ncbi:hypothetical protein AB0451_03250 [Streptomyces sp. NPDC052000]|uniref:hypothetical protein n=1 Tax=Streptomyces sp. NPDC052000 TaxID=3155676 RepID=UPI00344D8889
MSGSTYWPREVKRAEDASPKKGAIRRLDRLRSISRSLDPVIANRMWGEIGDALQPIIDRYTT